MNKENPDKRLEQAMAMIDRQYGKGAIYEYGTGQDIGLIEVPNC
jgi:hypothetical protein